MKKMNIQSVLDEEPLTAKRTLERDPRFLGMDAEPSSVTIEKQRSLISKLAMEKHELEQKLKAVSPEFNGKSQRVAKDSGGYA
jgi:hypothetical protein